MKTRGPILAAALVALALPGCALWGERIWPARDADAAVALRFAWPLGLSSRVSFERQRELRTLARSERARWAGSYRFTVLAAPEGRLIRYDDFEISDHEVSGRAAAPGAMLREASSRLAVLVPSLVVRPDGTVVRVEGLERLQAEVERLLATSRAAKDAERVRTLVERLLSEERLVQAAADEWNALVGGWAGLELEPGVVYEARNETELPLFEGSTLPTRFEVSLLQQLPCPTLSREPDCVELELRSSPDPQAIGAFLESLTASAAGDARPVAFDELAFETRIHLITEPATLVPHALETTRTLRATLRAGSGGPERIESRDRRVYRFRYAD